MAPPKILLFGDSHSYAIQRALERREKKRQPIPLQAYRLLKMKNDVQVGDTSLERFTEIARKLRRQDIVLSAIGGNNHAVFSTIQHPVRFDFVDFTDDSETEEGVPTIPYRTLEAYFAQAIRNRDAKSIEALRKSTKARVVHMLPPPPKADNQFIREYHESVFAKDGIISQGVSAPRLRLRFWKLQARVLANVCGEFGVEVMAPPQGALDPEGFLAREYYAHDATHANPDYGELVLQQVEHLYRGGEMKAAVRS